MKINIAWALLAILALAMLAAGCAQTSEQVPAAPQRQPTGAAKTVMITAEGFSPSAIEINAGDAINFVNKDSVDHWPASAQHPTHKLYPETGGCVGSKFDACTPLANEESFTFVFYEKGEWNYHDHLNCCTDSRFFGKVTVR